MGVGARWRGQTERTTVCSGQGVVGVRCLSVEASFSAAAAVAADFIAVCVNKFNQLHVPNKSPQVGINSPLSLMWISKQRNRNRMRDVFTTVGLIQTIFGGRFQA